MNKLTEKNKIRSNKSFGIVFFIIFLIIGLWPLLNAENIRIWSLIVSFVFLILVIFKSKILTTLNRIWFFLRTRTLGTPRVRVTGRKLIGNERFRPDHEAV